MIKITYSHLFNNWFLVVPYYDCSILTKCINSVSIYNLMRATNWPICKHFKNYILMANNYLKIEKIFWSGSSYIYCSEIKYWFTRPYFTVVKFTVIILFITQLNQYLNCDCYITWKPRVSLINFLANSVLSIININYVVWS